MPNNQSIAAALASGIPSYSFEFFPPKTDKGEETLWRAIRTLEPLAPTFVSVTYGAGGTTRDRTARITGRIAAETTLTPVAHLTCVGSSVAEIRSVVAQYADAGVTNVLALRGDPEGGPGSVWVQHPDGLRHADELVALVKSLGDFTVGVAAFPEVHPEAPDAEFDALVLKKKQNAGASFAATQFFFSAKDYFQLQERADRVGVSMPLIPGIMPVTNLKQIRRFAELSGAEFPVGLADRFLALADDEEAVRQLGVEVATDMCRELLDNGAPGLHFYTLNRSTATLEIYENLGLRPGQART